MGALVIVATPIGNLSDISPRALEALRSADLIACEDTLQTLKLLNHFGIQQPLVSYHDFNEERKAEGLGEKIRNDMAVAGSYLQRPSLYGLLSTIQSELALLDCPHPTYGCNLVFHGKVAPSVAS